MRSNRGKLKIIRYLLYIALVTTIVTSVSLARYASSQDIYAKGLVASLATGSTTRIDVPLDDMYPGMSEKTVRFNVVNYSGDKVSEVAMDYEIQIETTGNLPLAFSLRGDKQSGDSDPNSLLVGTMDPDTRKAVGGRLPIAGAGQKTEHTYQLTVTWPETEASVDYSKEIDMLTIRVNAAQVDGR